jgi:hypothetical protein
MTNFEIADRINEEEEFDSPFSYFNEYGRFIVKSQELFNNLTQQEKLELSCCSELNPRPHIYLGDKGWCYISEYDRWEIIYSGNEHLSYITLDSNSIMLCETGKIYRHAE